VAIRAHVLSVDYVLHSSLLLHQKPPSAKKIDDYFSTHAYLKIVMQLLSPLLEVFIGLNLEESLSWKLWKRGVLGSEISV
jgi:hypothetical protein